MLIVGSETNLPPWSQTESDIAVPSIKPATMSVTIPSHYPTSAYPLSFNRPSYLDFSSLQPSSILNSYSALHSHVRAGNNARTYSGGSPRADCEGPAKPSPTIRPASKPPSHLPSYLPSVDSSTQVYVKPSWFPSAAPSFAHSESVHPTPLPSADDQSLVPSSLSLLSLAPTETTLHPSFYLPSLQPTYTIMPGDARIESDVPTLTPSTPQLPCLLPHTSYPTSEAPSHYYSAKPHFLPSYLPSQVAAPSYVPLTLYPLSTVSPSRNMDPSLSPQSYSPSKYASLQPVSFASLLPSSFTYFPSSASLLPTVEGGLDCSVEHPEWLGDGWCDRGPYNGAVCDYDKGDCCMQTCAENGDFPCGTVGYSCLDPNFNTLATSRKWYFYSTNFTNSADPDLSLLNTLIFLSLDYFIWNKEIEVIAVTSTLDNLPLGVPTNLYHYSVAAQESITYSIVNSSINYRYLNSGDSNFLLASLSSGQFERAMRHVARRLEHADFYFLTLCSEENMNACAVKITDSSAVTASDQGCSKRQSAAWNELYFSPERFPIVIVWYLILLLAYSALLLNPLMELLSLKLPISYSHLIAMFAQANCCVLRVLYFAYVLSVIFHSDSLDRIACAELDFLEEDFDPTYTILQALFYLAFLCAVTLYVEYRRRQEESQEERRSSRSRRWILGLLLACVLALCIWLIYIVCIVYFESATPYPSFDNVRTFSQCFVGIAVVFVALYFVVMSKQARLVLAKTLLLAATGIITTITSFAEIYEWPGLSFALYTVLGRILELLSLFAIQLESSRRSMAEQGLSPINVPRSSSDSLHADFNDVKEIMGRVRARQEGFPPSRLPDANESVIVTDRIFPSPRQPGWIWRWTNRVYPIELPVVTASLLFERMSLRREIRDVEAMEEIKSEENANEELAERVRKRPRNI